ncbi:MAG TPA: ribosome small subunit-dependent GTPase A [Gemmatimonadaceae bacterium]|nr:ribosome small subunit-dependent GTPase A [Gemmatimonadaceae bacterium]
MTPAASSDESRTEVGIVLEGTGGVWRVRTDGGETIEASLRGRLKQEPSEGVPLKLAVGDRVGVAPDERSQAWTIVEILPRRSQLGRRAPGGKRTERVLAANVDQVVVVFSIARPEPHVAMLDRFLAIAEANDLPARIVVNKVDLGGAEAVEMKFGHYRRAGYPVHLTSVPQALGLDELRQALAGCASVLTGPSGVGKSSLLNELHPGLGLRVGEISESVNKGRHTTVGGYLHPLPGGGYVVDTPGLREVGLWGVPSRTLEQCFPELRPLLGECRFADCAHRTEPGCAVRDAVKRGDVAASRYESYLKLREELEEAERAW